MPSSVNCKAVMSINSVFFKWTSGHFQVLTTLLTTSMETTKLEAQDQSTHLASISLCRCAMFPQGCALAMAGWL